MLPPCCPPIISRGRGLVGERRTGHDSPSNARASDSEALGADVRGSSLSVGLAGKFCLEILPPGMWPSVPSQSPSAGPFISRGARGATMWASFAATGRGWRHPSPTCRRPAPGRRARWLKIQGARCDRFRRSVSNGAEPETAERHMARTAWGQTRRVSPQAAAACSG